MFIDSLNMKHILLFPTVLLALISNSYLHSQTPNHVFDKSDSVIIREVYNMALSEGEAYENLRYLCKEIGARITGSTEAQMAVEWGQKIMSEYGFEVSLQEITVPHWERGTKEAFWIRDNNGTVYKLNGLALGGSVGTNGILRGELIVFDALEEL